MKEVEGFSPEQEKDIVHLFRIAEESNKLEMIMASVKVLADTYGNMNFSELEKVLKKHKFNVGFLAIPVEKFHPNNEWVAVDAATFSIRCKNVAIPTRNITELQSIAEYYHIDYDPLKNLDALADAGIPIPVQGTEEARRMRGLSRVN